MIEYIPYIMAAYCLPGVVLFFISTPIQEQDYLDTSDFFVYLVSWPIELWRMYKHLKEEE